MVGSIIIIENITRKMVQTHKSVLFVFGDNMAETGYGGQAAVMRGEPNSIGIPTKWRPSWDKNAFFSNKDVDNSLVLDRIYSSLHKIENHLNSGYDVVIPLNGVGSGRAELSTRAPKILHLIEDGLNKIRLCYSEKRNF